VLTTDHTVLYATRTFTLHAATERHRAFWPVLIFRPAECRRLSWPDWLVTNGGGLPARRRSPFPVLTGPGVE